MVSSIKVILSQKIQKADKGIVHEEWIMIGGLQEVLSEGSRVQLWMEEAEGEERTVHEGEIVQVQIIQETWTSCRIKTPNTAPGPAVTLLVPLRHVKLGIVAQLIYWMAYRHSPDTYFSKAPLDRVNPRSRQRPTNLSRRTSKDYRSSFANPDPDPERPSMAMIAEEDEEWV
ncbi:hypothetical protein CVT26_013570 [Gymnopilus dilepis]|uniref:Uncharacterized protein n=1 Tax=Gymnopilus dilepis TaxID=231916 RepID=A0A409Y5U0_9AGAR|nr:hypothetical protein CVT26_013570 [Gymnopilus dilepis]